MKTTGLVICLAASVLGGCSLLHVAPDATPVSVVLDHLKTELALFQKTKPNHKPTGNVCKGPNGYQVVNIVPTAATLVLKVSASDTYTGSAGASFPVASVVTVGPSVSGSYATVNTQQVILDLKVDHNKTKSELRSEIESLKKEIDGDSKGADAVQKSDSKLAAYIRKTVEKKSAALVKAYTELMDAEAGSSSTAPANQSYSEAAFKDHPLADTLWKVREELLKVNHNQGPCLQPGQLKSQIDFQVVKKVSGDVKISFLVVNIGGGMSTADDRTQSLIVTFDMADGSTPLVAQ